MDLKTLCLMYVGITRKYANSAIPHKLVWVNPFIHCALLLASLSFLSSQHFVFNIKRPEVIYLHLSPKGHGKGTKMEVEEKTNQAPFICYPPAFLFKMSSLYFKKALLLQECMKRQLHLPGFLKCFPKAAEGNQ